MPDFGCYVTIENECTSSLMLQSKHKNDNARWEVEPPDIINEHKHLQFVLKDTLGLVGSEGSVEYMLDAPKNPELEIKFSCPFPPGSKNTFTVKSTHASIMKVEKHGPDPTKGHPMHGKYFPTKVFLSTLPLVYPLTEGFPGYRNCHLLRRVTFRGTNGAKWKPGVLLPNLTLSSAKTFNKKQFIIPLKTLYARVCMYYDECI